MFLGLIPKDVKDMLLSWKGSSLWEKKEKDLDFSSPLHLLDCLEGKKPHSFEEWDVSCTEAKTFFCI